MKSEPVPAERPGRERRFDGRRLRSERTKQLIIEAHLELLRRAPLQTPTARQIAAQAGCSVRSVFERFENLDTLKLATADYAIAAGQVEALARDVDGDRQTRIRSHVTTRAQACEKWLPLWRILTTTQHQLPELKERILRARRGNIERMRQMYRPELATLAEAEREALLVALAILISFESWEQLRDCYGLSLEAAQDVWIAAIDRMLP